MKTALEKCRIFLSASNISSHCSSERISAAKSVSTSAHNACSCFDLAITFSPHRHPATLFAPY
jgi:hypothetical protein